MLKNLTALAIVVLTVAGCALEAPDEPGDYVTETVVVFGADGQETVHVRELTRDQAAQEAAFHELMEESAIEGGEFHIELAKDPTCMDASLRMYDEPNLQGHRICFTGSYDLHIGRVTLGDYCRVKLNTWCFGTWSESVRSYRAGDFQGYFFAENLPQGYYRYSSFPAWQIENSANYIVQAATHLSIGPFIP